jgi:hypothetical protein
MGYTVDIPIFSMTFETSGLAMKERFPLLDRLPVFIVAGCLNSWYRRIMFVCSFLFLSIRLICMMSDTSD